MPQLPIKVRHTHSDGTTTIRRATLDSRATYPALVSLVRDRFQLAPETQVELLYKDDDGDDITFTTDIELREYLDLATTGNFLLRLHAPRSGSAAPTTTYHDDTADVDDWEFEDGEDAAQGKDDSVTTPALIETVVVDATAAADPEETPLAPAPASASIAQRTQALIDAEFPTSSSSAAADPIEEPLPEARAHTPAGAAPDMPFTGLPSSLASLLSGLPSHAGALGTHVSGLLASPQSALGRLSVLASDPLGAGVSSLDLSDLGRSVAQLSAHLSDAAREVVEGVRKEADSVRTEFEQLRAEVAREKSRFEDEVRSALEQAKQSPSPFAPRPATTTASREAATDEYEMGATSRRMDDEVESSDEGEPEEAYVQRAASQASSPAPSTRPMTQAERAAKEQRRQAREQRKRDKEARRARRADKAARNAAKAGIITAHELLRNQEHAQGGVSQAPLEAEGGSSRMPGSLPGAHQAPSPASSSSPPSPRFVPASQLLSSAPPGAWTPEAPASRLAEQHADDGRPVLLTNLLLAVEELGIDVQGHPQLRTLLTDIWCDSNGRGLSRMIERALDELA
ncbi:hypothetical protein JCM9279_004364 [Rhodotorula babjevae]